MGERWTSAAVAVDLHAAVGFEKDSCLIVQLLAQIPAVIWLAPKRRAAEAGIEGGQNISAVRQTVREEFYFRISSRLYFSPIIV